MTDILPDLNWELSLVAALAVFFAVSMMGCRASRSLPEYIFYELGNSEL